METTTKPTTIAQQVERLNKIFEMIETCKNLINCRVTLCEEAHGRSESGLVNCRDSDLKFCEKYYAICNRLKRSYNDQLKSMKSYSI